MDLIRHLFNFGDTYYQSSPESFWIKLLLAIISGILSFGIAYFVFYLQNKKKDDDEKKRISELRDYVYYCLDALLKLIKQQATLLDERIEDLKKDVTPATYYALHRPMQISVGLNLKQIEKLEVNDTFKILVTNEAEDQQNIKNYQFLMGSGEQLEKISEGLNETNKWGSETYEKYLDLILFHKDQINVILVDIAQEYMLPQDSDSYRHVYMKELLDIWWNYNKEKDDLLESIVKVVKKIMEFCNYTPEDEGSAFDEPESKKFLTAGQKINEHYDIIIQNKSTQLFNLKLWVTDLRKSKAVYEDISERIYPDKIQENEGAKRAKAVQK